MTFHIVKHDVSVGNCLDLACVTVDITMYIPSLVDILYGLDNSSFDSLAGSEMHVLYIPYCKT
jgi:hypothetical protein